jgi:hypothetical protein
MLCNICLDEILNQNEQLLTKCNHLFHKNCLIQIIYPTCPCCKSDITKLLNNNGISNNKIKQNKEAEEFRLLISNLDLELFDAQYLFNLCLNTIKLNNLKWKNIYKNIILSFIFNAHNTFQSFSNEMFNSNKPGIFLYYCDLEDIILNLIHGYKSSVIQWYEEKNFQENKNFICFSKGVYNKIKNDYQNKFGVLFVIKDNYNNKTIIFNNIFDKENIIKNYPSNKSILKSMCELEPIKLDQQERYNPENNILELMIKYIKHKNIFNYTVKYKSFIDFIQNDIEKYLKKKENKNKNAFIHFKFYNNLENNLDNTIENNIIENAKHYELDNENDFYYFIDNRKKKIIYNDIKNSSSLKIKLLDTLLMNILITHKNSIVRLIIGDTNFTKICAYSVKYSNEECYFNKLEKPIIEQLFNINLSDDEKYKKILDFDVIYI